MKELWLTSQIRNLIDRVQQIGQKVDLYVRPDTYLTCPLLNKIANPEYRITVEEISMGSDIEFPPPPALAAVPPACAAQ